MRKVFANLIYATVIAFILVSVSAVAQDTVKLSVAYQNLNVANTNLPGGNLGLDVKVASHGKWRLGALADVSYHRDTNRVLDRFQFLGGPQVSYAPGEGKVSFFGRGLFGATRFDQRRGNSPDFARATVSIGGGINVKLTDRFSVNALQGDLQYIDERGARYTRLGAGIVVGVF